MMSPWERLLERPQPRGHFVQIYEAGETSLTNNVGLYLWEGLRRGDGVLVIATPEHWEMFCGQLSQLGADTPLLVRNQQLVRFDAQRTLMEFMIDGQPDWRLFEQTVSGAMRRVRPAGSEAGLRAYGEMVGILWNAKQFAAAIRLEQLWNKLLEQSSFSLYCSYAIDIFGKDFQAGVLDGVLRTHTHLLPAQSNGNLEMALNKAMDEVLGIKADGLKALVEANYRPSWAIMPNAESTVLWLKKNLPGKATDIMERARRYYHLSSPSRALTAPAAVEA
jgi:hypothetical protein